MCRLRDGELRKPSLERLYRWTFAVFFFQVPVRTILNLHVLFFYGPSLSGERLTYLHIIITFMRPTRHSSAQKQYWTVAFTWRDRYFHVKSKKYPSTVKCISSVDMNFKRRNSFYHSVISHSVKI